MSPIVPSVKSENTEPKRWPRRVKVGHATVIVYRMAHEGGKSGFTHVVAWNTPQGRKRRKIAVESKAMEEARIIAGRLSAGMIDAADVSAGDREELAAARDLIGGAPLLSVLREWKEANAICGGNILAGVRFYAEHFKNADRKTILVKDVVKAFMKAKKAEGIDIRSSYERVLPRLRDGVLGELPIDAIGKDQLADWISTAFAVEGKERAHPETFNTARRRFVTMWKWSRDEGFLPKLAKTAAEEIRTRKDTNTHVPIGIMTLAGWKASLALIHKEAPALLASLVLGGFCGLRRAELAKQKWDDIDLERGLLRVTKAKPRTPARRLVPISGAARKWLKLCPRNGERIGASWASDHVRARVKAAGIECPANALRHSFISYRCAETGSVDKTAQEAGNSPKIIFQHYRELVSPRDGRAWFTVSPPR